MTQPAESIIDEVRSWRTKFAADCGHDADRIFEEIAAIEREHPERVVRRVKHVTYTVEPAYETSGEDAAE